MKIKINKDPLNKALSFLLPGIPSKSIIMVDQQVLFSIRGENCTLRISNPACEMSAFVKVESEGDVDFACPIHRIQRTVANFPEGVVNITTKDNDLGFIGAIQMRAKGVRNTYKIACYTPEHFPQWSPQNDSIVNITVPMREFHDKMKITSLNIQANNPNTAFANITLFQNDQGGLSLLTGDNLIVGKMDLPAKIPKSFIVDKVLARLTAGMNFEGDCNISIDESQLVLSHSGLALACKMVHKKVPGYQPLFDNEPEDKFTITKDEIMKSLTRVAAYNDDTNRVKLEIIEGNSLRIYAYDGNNEAEEIIEILNEKNLELNVNMSHVLLRQAMSAVKADTIEMGMSKGRQQVFLTPAGGNKENQTWMFAPFGDKG